MEKAVIVRRENKNIGNDLYLKKLEAKWDRDEDGVFTEMTEIIEWTYDKDKFMIYDIETFRDYNHCKRVASNIHATLVFL